VAKPQQKVVLSTWVAVGQARVVRRFAKANGVTVAQWIAAAVAAAIAHAEAEPGQMQHVASAVARDAAAAALEEASP